MFSYYSLAYSLSLFQLHTFMVTSQGLVMTSWESCFSSMSRVGVDLYAIILGERKIQSARDLGLISGR